MANELNPLNPPYWQYFLAIEDDLFTASRFVEFAPDNFNVYSLEFARLLISSSSEIDVIAKEFCNLLSHNTKCENIKDYQDIILTKYPKFVEVEVHIPRFSISSKPWINWAGQGKLEWWKAYNGVKHERSKYYDKATLGNVVDSVAGLFTILLYYYRHLQTLSGDGRVQLYLNPPPKLFASNKYLSSDIHTQLWAFDFPDKVTI